MPQLLILAERRREEKDQSLLRSQPLWIRVQQVGQSPSGGGTGATTQPHFGMAPSVQIPGACKGCGDLASTPKPSVQRAAAEAQGTGEQEVSRQDSVFSKKGQSDRVASGLDGAAAPYDALCVLNTPAEQIRTLGYGKEATRSMGPA